jgi:hypothetical protein
MQFFAGNNGKIWLYANICLLFKGLLTVLIRLAIGLNA